MRYLLNIGEEAKMSIEDSFKKMMADNLELSDALGRIDRDFKKQLSEHTTEEERRQYFLGEKAELRPTMNFKELIEFWRALEPYACMREKGYLEGYWIIQVMKEVNTAWQVYQLNCDVNNRKFEDIRNFKKLLERIEDLEEKAYLITVRYDKKRAEIDGIYSLKYFDEEYYHPYRDYIVRNILQAAGENPIFVVGSGKKDALSSRGKSYEIYPDLSWKEKRNEETEISFESAERNFSARRRGLMIGYALEDL